MKVIITPKAFLSKSKKAWFQSHINDPFVKKAQSMNYRSRASFKLIEILEKNKHIKIGSVLDLGCAPGSWSQVIIQRNPDCKLIAVDLLEMKEIKGVQFQKIDAKNKQLHRYLLNKYKNFETIMSDMAPNFSGDNTETHDEIIQLNKLCVCLSLELGGPQSNLIMKTLYGRQQRSFYNLISCLYDKIERFKPQSSRSHSEEFYYICSSLKNCNLIGIPLLVEFIGKFDAENGRMREKKDIQKQLDSLQKK